MRGRVQVSRYRGDRALYQHGFLKVSDNRRYLVYGNGTPFLWVGDTAWAVPQRANDEEWEAYIADRAAKHFTLIQVAPAPEWAGETDRQGQKPFTDRGCAQWNPAYWQSFAHKIQRANEEGLVVLLLIRNQPEDVTRRMVLARTPAGDLAVAYLPNNEAVENKTTSRFSPPARSDWVLLLERAAG